ncbi:hypothetical protein [Actinoallomurus soli]|uniref:hypothetical protein n=1 Tax=Actinoallomurus soli TaxID=2952535 RepID=UPI002093B551|nr:hypothetical protein [Actinoallomurus soli]MCO5967425.1 hypothetical protein [Actinoallomurus soli]
MTGRSPSSPSSGTAPGIPHGSWPPGTASPWPGCGRTSSRAWEGSLIRARADRSAEAFASFFALVFGALLPAGDREPA